MTLLYYKITDNGLMSDVKRLCDLIVNSSPETTLKGDIESLALQIGHHPDVLNPKDEIPEAVRFAEWLGKTQWVLHKNGLWYAGTEESKTTQELFKIFKNQH